MTLPGRIFTFFVPGGLLAFGTFLLARSAFISPWLSAITEFTPYLIPGIGALLCWRFNRSRPFFLLLCLFIVERSAAYSPENHFLFYAYALLLPLNYGLFSILRERGLLTVHGLFRMALIALQCALVAWTALRRPDLAALVMEKLGNLSPGSDAHLTTMSLVPFSVVSLLLLAICLVRRSALATGFFWSLVAAFSALTRYPFDDLSILSFAAAGLILIAALLEAVYGMAYRDELTGLRSRRALDEELLKLRGSFAVAMLDIDHFKKFNDRYGHDTGDQVLRMVAAIFSRVSGGGRAFRYGGEEFTILFPGTSSEEAFPHLEKLRETVGQSPFSLRGRNRPRRKPKEKKRIKGKAKKVAVTVSIGVASREGRQPPPAEVIKEADKALYRAKRRGRNKVVR